MFEKCFVESPRVSLKAPVLQNEKIALDRMMKYSLLHDLVKGKHIK